MSDLRILRTRLEHMRDELLGRLSIKVDGGDLALLGNIGAALAQVDALLPDGARVIVSADGRGIRRTTFVSRLAVASAEISAQRALGLASELLAASSRDRD